MPQFDKERARTMALTEVLADSSAAQHESYVQSPAVDSKILGLSAKDKEEIRIEALANME